MLEVFIMLGKKTKLVKNIIELIKIVAKVANMSQLERIYKYIVMIYRE